MYVCVRFLCCNNTEKTEKGNDDS